MKFYCFFEIGEEPEKIKKTLNLSKDLLVSDLEFKLGEDPRYSFYETIIEYGGIEQKWVVVHSSEMQKRKDITFERKIQKKVTESQKDLIGVTQLGIIISFLTT